MLSSSPGVIPGEDIRAGKVITLSYLDYDITMVKAYNQVYDFNILLL